MTRENFIISVDDFGISQKANTNILSLVRLKKIDRVSVMTNGMISQKEIDELLRSEVKLDIHLNLEKLDSVRKPKKGVFGRSFNFLFLYTTGAIGAGTAEISWKKQVEKFETLFGKKPDGANSHQHIHFFPAYLKVLMKLCNENNIPYLRFGKKYFKGCFNLICLVLNILRLRSLKKFFRFNLDTSDFLISLDWIKNVKKFSAQDGFAPSGQIELVAHPERENEFEIIKKYF